VPVSRRRFESVRAEFEVLQSRAGVLADALRVQIDALIANVEDGLPKSVSDFHKANLRHVIRQLQGVEAQLRAEAEGHATATVSAGVHYAAGGAAKLLMGAVALVPGIVTVTQPGAAENSIDAVVSLASDLADDSGALLDWVLLNADDERPDERSEIDANASAPDGPHFVLTPDGFGHLLKRWRNQNVIGLRALATIVGVSERTIYEWEIGAGGRRRATSVQALRDYLQRTSARRALPGLEAEGSKWTEELISMLNDVLSADV